jgi:hypothetical protein
MADSILSSLLSASALKIVNDSDGNDQASDLKVSKISITFRARAMRHMKENGQTVVDVRIIDPTTIEIDAFAPSLDVINTFDHVTNNRSNTFTVTTKGLVFPAMSSDSLVIKQSADMLSASPMTITMKQLNRPVRSGKGPHKVVEQAADSSVMTKGINAVSAVTRPVTDTFDKAIGAALPKLPDIPTGIPIP